VLISAPEPKQAKNVPEQPPQEKADGLEGQSPDIRAQALLAGAGRIPATVRKILQVDVPASFPPKPEDESLVGVRDDAVVRAADNTVGIKGLNPDRG
jgi:hypothetical protein